VGQIIFVFQDASIHWPHIRSTATLIVTKHRESGIVAGVSGDKACSFAPSWLFEAPLFTLACFARARADLFGGEEPGSVCKEQDRHKCDPAHT
jgi:hypothetical protein